MHMPNLHGRYSASLQAGVTSEVTKEPTQQSTCLPPVRGWTQLNWRLNPYQATAAKCTQAFSNSLFQKIKISLAKIPSWLAICSGIHLCAVNEVSGVLRNHSEGANWNRAELALGEGVWAVEFSDYTYVISKGACTFCFNSHVGGDEFITWSFDTQYWVFWGGLL